MKVVLILCFVTLAAAGPVPLAPMLHEDAKEPIADEFLVVFHQNVTSEQKDSHWNLIAETSGYVKRFFDIGRLSGYHLHASDDVLSTVRGDPLVKYVEPNQVVRAYQSCNEQVEATWGIVRTAQRVLSNNGLYSYKANQGEGVDAYVIDTGIYTEHEDFEGRAVFGTDTVDTPSPETDLNGHGTHVAGTVLSKTWGIAKGGTAVAVRVLNANGSGSTAGVIGGIDWVTKTHQAKKDARSVSNMSLGGGKSSTMNSAVDESVAAGVVHVVAAGNEGQSACNVSPASSESAITVACSNNQDNMCSFSNHGECVDLIAPGQDITSCWHTGKFADNTISGTSMSAPHVAGVAAKIMSEAGGVMSPKEVLDALTNTATDNAIKNIRTGTPNKLVFGDCQ